MQSGLCHGRGLSRKASQFSTTFTNNTEPPLCLYQTSIHCPSQLPVTAILPLLLRECGALLPDPARTPRPVHPKKFGRWRKNSAANCYPRNQHFIQYYSDFTSLFLKGTFFIDPVKKQYITFYGIYSLVGFSTWYCQLCLTNTVHVRLRLEVIQNFISGCN